MNNIKYSLASISLLTLFLFNGGTGAAQANEPGSGNALDFDGANNYVQISDTSLWDFGNGSFSVSAWFITNTGVYDGIVAYDNVLTNGAWRMELRNDKVRFLICDSNRSGNCTAIISSNIVTDNKWHHAIGVRDASSGLLKLYIDGVMVAAPKPDGGYNIVGAVSSYPAIGRIGSYNLCCNFNGIIDEVRIWKRALTLVEIQDNMCQKLKGNEPGLVGYWRLDEGSGSTAFDSSPNNNDGTLQ